jgi:hypothetical protein
MVYTRKKLTTRPENSVKESILCKIRHLQFRNFVHIQAVLVHTNIRSISKFAKITIIEILRFVNLSLKLNTCWHDSNRLFFHW